MRSPFKSLRIVIIVFCVSCCQVERTSADEATGSRTGATGAEAFECDGEPISFGFQRYGFFNGGGGKSYRVRDGRLTMDWERGNNTGDVFFPGPKEFQCLANLQDSVQVDVRVNRDGEAIGDAGGGLYRSGPGLYLAQNRGGQVGVKGRHSISFVIGNETNDATNARCLLALSSLGAYSEGKQLASKPGVWKVGEWVTLRATYSSQDDDGHHYRFRISNGREVCRTRNGDVSGPTLTRRIPVPERRCSITTQAMSSSPSEVIWTSTTFDQRWTKARGSSPQGRLGRLSQHTFPTDLPGRCRRQVGSAKQM